MVCCCSIRAAVVVVVVVVQLGLLVLYYRSFRSLVQVIVGTPTLIGHARTSYCVPFHCKTYCIALYSTH